MRTRNLQEFQAITREISGQIFYIDFVVVPFLYITSTVAADLSFSIPLLAAQLLKVTFSENGIVREVYWHSHLR